MTEDRWIPIRRRSDGTEYDDRHLARWTLAETKRTVKWYDSQPRWQGQPPKLYKPDPVVRYELGEFDSGTDRILASYL